MPSKRQVLDQLTRDELQTAVGTYELEVDDKRVREQLVDALGGSRKASLQEILSELPRDRLKEICSALDLSDSGREKEVLIGRLIGEDGGDDARSRARPSTRKLLRSARLAVGLSQAEVGERVGVSQAMISHWENGRAEPSPEQLRKMSTFLELDGPNSSAARSDGATEDVSAFGVWLSRTRNEVGLTIPELANRTGVSIPQIYNIETGRTQNPRSETRDRLIKALGKPAPTEAIEATERDAEIFELGSLIDFDPHNESEVPADPGVYVFYDVSSRPIYVGESGNIRSRVRGHADKFWFKPPIVESAAYVRVPDQKLRRQIEQILIRFLKSNAVINRQHVDRN